jgi:capsule biosynthesis phosphatase
MRIASDLDGTICHRRKPDQSYAEVQPIDGALERLRQLRKAGHYIIVSTARNMKTCDGNVGRVLRNVGMITLEWLDRHGVEYDEIHFGKPNADLYIDDRAVRFETWDELDERRIETLAARSETAARVSRP